MTTLARRHLGVPRVWAVASMVMTLALGFLVPVASPSPPAAAQVAAQLELESPADGSVMIKRSKTAAQATTLIARLRVRGEFAGVSGRLNGQRINVTGTPGRHRISLSRASGLRLGDNQLRLEGRLAGRSDPVVVKRRFFVGYRAPLIAARVRVGDGTRPSAVATVRTPTTVEQISRLDASVNGRRVAVPVASGRPRLRSFNLGQLGQLVRGRNTFGLRLLMDDGRASEVQRRFIIDPGRNIAVARAVFAGNGKPDRLINIGQRVTLDAGRSVRLPIAVQNPARWRLIVRPPRSKARLATTAGSSPHGRVAFVPDVPGDYKIALRLGSGRRAGYDVLDLAATYTRPLISFSTITYPDGPASPPALQIGDDFYRAAAGDGIQVWRLNRRTLGYLEYRGFPLNQSGYAALGSYLQGVPITSLMVVNYPSNTPLADNGALTTLDNALQRIGGNLGAARLFPQSNCSTATPNQCQNLRWENPIWAVATAGRPQFSVIGVPGMTAGQAWRATADQNLGGTGTFTGYLTLGVATATAAANDYTVVPGGADNTVTLNSCAGVTCAVQIGSATLAASSGVANGIHVVRLNRTTLQVEKNETVTTFEALYDALTRFTYPQDIRRAIRGEGRYELDDQRLYVLQSIGTGRLTGTPSINLLTRIDQLGGTPETFTKTVIGTGPGPRYALVGALTNAPWHATDALESSTALGPTTEPGSPTGRITGVLQRNRQNQYSPATGDVTYNTNTSLAPILYDNRPWTWPLEEQTQLLAYFANNLGLSAYPTIRPAYPNRLIDFSLKYTQLQLVACSGPYGDFCTDPNFAKMKTQLSNEFEYVVTVRQLIEAFRAPYADNSGSAGFDVQQVTQEVLASLPTANRSAETTMKWLKIFSNLSSIAGIVGKFTPIGDGAAVFGLAAQAAGLTTNLMGTPDGGPADAVRARADEIAVRMSKLQSSYLQGVYRMEPILVGSWYQLQAIGSKVGSDPTWNWTTGTTIEVGVALSGNSRGSAYTALLPVAWGGWQLKAGSTESPTTNVSDYICNQQGTGTMNPPVKPFAGARPQNQFLAAYDFVPFSGVKYQIWTFANLGRWTYDRSPSQVPTTALTDNIYGPTSTGPNGAFQYEAAWWRSAYNPPGYTVCNVRSPGYVEWSQHYAPPSIPLPPP